MNKHCIICDDRFVCATTDRYLCTYKCYVCGLPIDTVKIPFRRFGFENRGKIITLSLCLECALLEHKSLEDVIEYAKLICRYVKRRHYTISLKCEECVAKDTCENFK